MTTQAALVIAQIENEISSLFGQIAYCNAALVSDIQDWEKKEYAGVIAANYDRIGKLENHLDEIKKIK